MRNPEGILLSRAAWVPAEPGAPNSSSRIVSLQKTWLKPGCGPALHCHPAGCGQHPIPPPQKAQSHGDRYPALRPVGRRHRGDQRHRVRRHPGRARQGPRPRGAQRHPRRAARGTGRHHRPVRRGSARAGAHARRRLRQLPGQAEIAGRGPGQVRTPARGVPRPRRALVPLQRRQRFGRYRAQRSRNSRPSTTTRSPAWACRRRSTTTSR